MYLCVGSDCEISDFNVRASHIDTDHDAQDKCVLNVVFCAKVKRVAKLANVVGCLKLIRCTAFYAND